MSRSRQGHMSLWASLSAAESLNSESTLLLRCQLEPSQNFPWSTLLPDSPQWLVALALQAKTRPSQAKPRWILSFTMAQSAQTNLHLIWRTAKSQRMPSLLFKHLLTVRSHNHLRLLSPCRPLSQVDRSLLRTRSRVTSRWSRSNRRHQWPCHPRHLVKPPKNPHRHLFRRP